MTDAKLLPCPFCGGAGYMERDHCPDGGGIFYAIKCTSCRAKSRSKYASTGNDCPQHYQEVRDEWNTRSDIARKVKPLVWDKHPDENEWYNLLTDSNYGPEMGYTITETVKGNYNLYMRSGDEKVGKYPTFEAAGDVAKSHLTHLILSATVDDIAPKPEWQPIETAPRDGTAILVVVAGYEPVVVSIHGEETRHPIPATDDDYERMSVKDWGLTHWMPLPEAPDLVTQGEE